VGELEVSQLRPEMDYNPPMAYILCAGLETCVLDTATVKALVAAAHLSINDVATRVGWDDEVDKSAFGTPVKEFVEKVLQATLAGKPQLPLCVAGGPSEEIVSNKCVFVVPFRSATAARPSIAGTGVTSVALCSFLADGLSCVEIGLLFFVPTGRY
jgi:hypothetical protein